MTTYWIDVEGCQRVISELQEIVDASNDFQWVDSDLMMVDRHTYAAQESANTQRDATKVDKAYYSFLEDKLEKTYDEAIAELKLCINTMVEVVDYYASGDAAMAYDANNLGTEEFPEYRSSDGSSTSGIPSPDGDGRPNGMHVPPPRPDPNNPLTDEHYTSHPYEYAYNVQTTLG